MNMKKKARMLSLVAIFLLTIASAANAKTIYVDADRPPGGGGTNRTDAYKYLKDALADADISAKPVEIRVAQSTYKPDEGAGLTGISSAVTVMDGPGPICGRARPPGYLIGGTDPIACEIICCKLVNLSADEISIIRTARQMGFGVSDSEQIEVVGDGLPASVCADFELAEPMRIRFSLLHVCKSACKQIVLLGKSAVRKSYTRRAN